MWRVHFKVENANEAIRKRLSKIGSFNAYEAFNSLDLNNDGAVHTGEIRRLVESRGFHISEKEAKLILSKFDRDLDKVISFNEFRMEILPKIKSN